MAKPDWYLEETTRRRDDERVTADLGERGSNLEQSLMRVSDNVRAASEVLASKVARNEVAEKVRRLAPILQGKTRPIDPQILAALTRSLYGRSERP